MAKVCELCNINTIFYIWASSRYFNINKFLTMRDISPRDVKNYLKNSHPVCMCCVKKHNLMER
jgi:hypothetical protein